MVEKFFAAHKKTESALTFWDTLPSDTMDIGGADYYDNLPDLTDMHEFDDWYNNTFNSGSNDMVDMNI